MKHGTNEDISTERCIEMDGINYTEKYNLPNAGTFPYNVYIKQLPYTFLGDDMKLQHFFRHGRHDLTMTFIKENNRWVPLR